MEKQKKKGKSILGGILLVLLSFTLLFLVIWLGFSFFSMRSDNPYVVLMIDFEGNTLAEKVVRDFPRKEGNSLTYSFPVILEQYTETDEDYTFIGIPFNYSYYYDSRDESRFEYTLSKNSGRFDFTEIEPNSPLVIFLKYRIATDFESYKDYSLCTFKKTYSKLFSLSNPCAIGNCVVKREVVEWSIETKDKDSVAKAEFFNDYSPDVLIRSLFNFYITDDLGYFKGDTFKLRSTQISLPDGSHKFDSVFVDQLGVSSGDSSTVSWMISGISGVYSKGYIEYDEVDLVSYMEKVSSLASDEFAQIYLVCQMGYDTVKNLSGCDSTGCQKIKMFAFNQCKNSIQTSLLVYDSYIEDYYGYHDTGSGNSFLWTLPSEMIYFNKLADALNLDVSRYTRNDILSYNTKAENLEEKRQTVVVSCHLLKNFEEIYSVYGDSTYLNKADSIISSLPEFETICDGVIRDGFCSLPISKKMVCADATMYRNRDLALNITYDLFYRHYFESPISATMTAYENFRRDFPRSNTGYVILDEYGYLSTRRESEEVDGTVIGLLSDMIDSYYFINVLLGDLDE